jgi:hypothetical protein
MLMTPLLVALLTAGCLTASAEEDGGGGVPESDGSTGAAAGEEPAGEGEPATPADPTEEPAAEAPADDEGDGTADAGTDSGSGLRIPVQKSSGGPRWTASMKGRLSGTVGENGTACLWVESGRGRLVLIWPAGYSAAADPLRVLDADGNTVATVGEQFSMGGGFVRGDAPVDADILGTCGDTGGFWLVGNVSR